MKKMSVMLGVCGVVCGGGGVALADANSQANKKSERGAARPQVLITKGYFEPVKNVAGTAYYVDEKTLKNQNASDINRVIRQVPGVNIAEEEGFGNRPNIGIRGGRIDRSADVTLMEDGVLIAPAPYSAPQAYFFPRIERMEGVEVSKGAASIQYGPRTTNGAINMLTKRVPDGPTLRANAAAGSFGGIRDGVEMGNSYDTEVGNFGVFATGYNEASDGFKEQDVVGGDTGFNLQDYMGKLRWKSDASASVYQELQFKVGYGEENANETYLGLTSEDFAANPYRRYAAAQHDEYDAVQNVYHLSHLIEPSNNLRIKTDLYRTDLTRTWDKLESVTIGATTRTIAAIMNDPTANAAYLNILKGGNSAPDALTLTEARRTFFAHGLQTSGNYRANWFGVANEIEIGARLHQDRYDRLQRNTNYQMTNGIMMQTSQGTFGTQTNRIGTTNAWSLYGLNRMDFGALSITPGVRYEYADLKVENYGTSDPFRSGANMQVFNSIVTGIIPGLGMEYDIDEAWQLIAGIHRGFSPPEPATTTAGALNAAPEESTNYEAGFRFTKHDARAEVVGFFTDYENLLGADTFSAGGGGVGDQFNGGKVHVVGLESAFGYEASKRLRLREKGFRVPVTFTYTYLKTEFQSSFNSSFGEWGNVQKGFELPYIPRHQYYVSAGLEKEQWSVSVNGKYQGKMRTIAGSGPLQVERATDANFTVDINAELEVAKGTRAFMSVNNVFDDVAVAARRPAGARPTAPRMVYGGLKFEF